jgi:hypothetical protein
MPAKSRRISGPRISLPAHNPKVVSSNLTLQPFGDCQKAPWWSGVCLRLEHRFGCRRLGASARSRMARQGGQKGSRSPEPPALRPPSHVTLPKRRIDRVNHGTTSKNTLMVCVLFNRFSLSYHVR